MAKKLVVEIVGDASSLQRALGTAGVEAEGFGSKLGGVAKMAGLALGGAAVGGLALVLDKSVKAAMAAQTSEAQLNTALKNTHQSAAAMAPALDRATAAARSMGFENSDTRSALAKLEIATGSTTKSVRLLSTAQDIARFKQTSLTNATKMLAMAMTGSQRAAKQLGITVPTVTTNYDALKASGEKLTTAQGILDAAHAKLLDKMATGNAVIQAVNDKLHGQAQAYADTAAGGMQVFHAQLENIEESIGNKLLPIFTSLLQWVNAHWPEISAVASAVFSEIGAGITALQPFFALLKQGFNDIVAWVRANWPQIQSTVQQVMTAVGQVIGDVVTVVRAVWSEFGTTITSVVKTAFTTIYNVIKDTLTTIKDTIKLVTDLIHGNWSGVWNDLKGIVSSTLGGIVALLQGAVGIVGAIAGKIGSMIVNGIVGGLKDLGSLMWAVIRNAINSVIAGIDDFIGLIDSIKLPSVSIFGHKIGGGSLFNVPSIPQLDTGGTILQTGLAVVHQGETITPRGGGGDTYHITVQALDMTQAARKMIDAINAVSRGKGQVFIDGAAG